MKISTIILTLFLGLISCKQEYSSKVGLSSKIDSPKLSLDTIMYNNYREAIDHESTFQYFIVIKVKNLNNETINEICTTGNALKGALHKEYNLKYDSIGQLKVHQLAIDNHKRYFEFKNNLAIKNVFGNLSYTKDDLSKLEKQINFDTLANQIQKHKKWSLKSPDDKTILMYAHALFNRGILTGESSCAGGTLYYVSSESIDKQKEQFKKFNERLKELKSKK